MMTVLPIEKRLFLISEKGHIYAMSDNIMYKMDANFTIKSQACIEFPFTLGHVGPGGRRLCTKPNNFVVHKVANRYVCYVYDSVYHVDLSRMTVRRIYEKQEFNQSAYDSLGPNMQTLYNHNGFFVAKDGFVVQNQLTSYQFLDGEPYDAMNLFTRIHHVTCSFAVTSNTHVYLVNTTMGFLRQIKPKLQKVVRKYQTATIHQDDVLLLQDSWIYIQSKCRFYKKSSARLNSGHHNVCKMEDKNDGRVKTLAAAFGGDVARMLACPWMYHMAIKQGKQTNLFAFQSACKYDIYAAAYIYNAGDAHSLEVEVSQLTEDNIMRFFSIVFFSGRCISGKFNQIGNRILKYCRYEMLTNELYQLLMSNVAHIQSTWLFRTYFRQLFLRAEYDPETMRKVNAMAALRNTIYSELRHVVETLYYNRKHMKSIQMIFNHLAERGYVSKDFFWQVCYLLTREQFDTHIPQNENENVSVLNVNYENWSMYDDLYDYCLQNADFHNIMTTLVDRVTPEQLTKMRISEQKSLQHTLLALFVHRAQHSADLQRATEGLLVRINDAGISLLDTVHDILIRGTEWQHNDAEPLGAAFRSFVVNQLKGAKVTNIQLAYKLMTCKPMLHYFAHNTTPQQHYCGGVHLISIYLENHHNSFNTEFIEAVRGTAFLDAYTYDFKNHNFQLNAEWAMQLMQYQRDFCGFAHIGGLKEMSDGALNRLLETAARLRDRHNRAYIRRLLWLQDAPDMGQLLRWLLENDQLELLADDYFTIGTHDVFGRNNADVRRLLAYIGRKGTWYAIHR